MYFSLKIFTNLIALNYKPSFECDYYLFSNSKRYDEFSSTINIDKTIITSNILADKSIEIVLDIKPLVFINKTFIINVAVVAINYLISKQNERRHIYPNHG